MAIILIPILFVSLTYVVLSF